MKDSSLFNKATNYTFSFDLAKNTVQNKTSWNLASGFCILLKGTFMHISRSILIFWGFTTLILLHD